MKPKLLLDPSFRETDIIFGDHDLARVHAAADVLWGQDAAAPEEEIEKIKDDVEIIVCGFWRHGDVARFPKLRAIMEVGGGFPSPKTLDYAACFARGIRVLTCSPAFGPAVAEMALGLALATARQIGWTDRSFRTGKEHWSHTDFSTAVGEPFTHYRKTVGLIGFGGLAQSLVRLIAPFECEIKVYDPWLTDIFVRQHGVTPVDIDELLSTSRIIYVLAVPSSGNKAFLDREKLELVRSDAVFLLMSRSHVVDFDVLTEFVQAGRFRAGIDVFPEEPLPIDHPIREAEHAVLSSHRAGAIGEGLHAVGASVADDVEAIAAGLVPFSMKQAEPEFIQLRG